MAKQKLTTKGQLLSIVPMVICIIAALMIKDAMGYSGVLYGALFGAIGGAVGGAIGMVLAKLTGQIEEA